MEVACGEGGEVREGCVEDGMVRWAWRKCVGVGAGVGVGKERAGFVDDGMF